VAVCSIWYWNWWAIRIWTTFTDQIHWWAVFGYHIWVY